MQIISIGNFIFIKVKNVNSQKNTIVKYDGFWFFKKKFPLLMLEPQNFTETHVQKTFAA